MSLHFPQNASHTQIVHLLMEGAACRADLVAEIPARSHQCCCILNQSVSDYIMPMGRRKDTSLSLHFCGSETQ